MADSSSGSTGVGLDLISYSTGRLEAVEHSTNAERVNTKNTSYRDLLTDNEMNMTEQTELQRAAKRVISRLESMFSIRQHLTPHMDSRRVPKVLSALWKCGHFSRTSAIREAYSDISEKQILSGDPSIQHRLPVLPVQLKDGEALNPVAIGKQDRLDAKLHALSLRSGVPLEELQKKFTTQQYRTRKQLAAQPWNEIPAITAPVIRVAKRHSSCLYSAVPKPPQDNEEAFDREPASKKIRRCPDVPIPIPGLQSTVLTDPPGHFELPFKIQHKLLATLQNLLEEALFDFALKWLPNVLHNMNWYTSEQGELQKWWAALVRYGGRIPGTAVNFQDTDLTQLFRRIAQLRHAAVHRLPTSNDKISREFLRDAMLIASGLRDIVRSKNLNLLKDALDGDNGIPNIAKLQELLGMKNESRAVGRIVPFENDIPKDQAKLELAPDPSFDHVEEKSESGDDSIYQKLLDSLDTPETRIPF